MTRNRIGSLVRMLILATGVLPISVAAEVPSLTPPPPAPGGPGSAQTARESIAHTPPRLSFISGEVSFWRPGADGWTPAVVNTALAPGDYLYAGQGANLELQVAGRAFVRAAGDTQLALTNQDLGSLQLALSGGLIALDLRELPAGYSIEVGTITAALTIDQAGYYLVEAQPAAAAVTVERGGRATLTVAGGASHGIGSGQQVVVRDDAQVSMETFPAPQPSEWDSWNHARTDALLATQSGQYMSLTMYGASDLDRYGTWRADTEYGPVWVPQQQPAEWAPYSTGRWMWDPYYGWTWVDDAPWGWAPYHYGRWVFLDRYWAWAPGPLIGYPAYSPALVGFFGGWGGFAGGSIGWIALGWGEPIIPWWGPAWFVGRPCWIGWYGPRVVNNVVITKTTIVNVKDVKHYKNARVYKAVVAVPPEKFDARHVQKTRSSRVDLTRLEPVATVPAQPSPTSFVGATGPTVRPPARLAERNVVTRRALQEEARALRAVERGSRTGESGSEAGGRPDAVMRSSRPPTGDGGRGAARSGEPRFLSPMRQSGLTPPPPPGRRPAEPGRAWMPGQSRRDDRVITAPENAVRAPDRGGRDASRPPAIGLAPERPVVQPRARTREGGRSWDGTVVPPGGIPGGRPREAPPAGRRVERRVDWPQAPTRSLARPPAPPVPRPTVLHPAGPDRLAPQGSPRVEWGGGREVMRSLIRPPSGRDWGGSMSPRGGRVGGGNRGQGGQR